METISLIVVARKYIGARPWPSYRAAVSTTQPTACAASAITRKIRLADNDECRMMNYETKNISVRSLDNPEFEIFEIVLSAELFAFGMLL
jgi:hypothetical protein